MTAIGNDIPAQRPFVLGPLIESAKLPAGQKEILRQAVVTGVEVDKNAGTWLVHLRVPGPVRPECLDVLGGCMEQTTGVTGVRFDVVQAGQADLAQVCEQCWDDVRQAVCERHPSLIGWLARAERLVAGDTLRLRVPGVGLEFVRRKDGHRLIQEHLAKAYGLNCRVVLETATENPPAQRGMPEIYPVLNAPGGPTAASNGCGQSDVQLPAQTGADVQPHTQAKAQAQNQAHTKTLSASRKKTTGEALLGKVFAGQPLEIASITEEEKSVIIAGRVFNPSVRSLRNGQELVSFYLTDGTDSITVKVFVDPKRESGRMPPQDGMHLKVRGGVRHDQFLRELVVIAKDINTSEWTEKADTAADKRVELHLHTKMSSMDGVANVAAVIERAARWGHPAVAITDHGVVQAFPEAAELAAKHGIKVIYGLEGYLFDNDTDAETARQQAYHVIILVRDQQGLGNLYRLVSLSHLEHFYRRPRIPRRELARYREGLLLGSACEAGELIRAYVQGRSWEELKEIAAFYDYLEIQPTGNNEFMVRSGEVKSHADLEEMNRRIVQLARELHKPVVATCDVHFVDPEDALFRRVLMAGQGYQDEEQAPLFFRTTDEMLAEFAYLDAGTAREVVIENTLRITELIGEVQPIPDRSYPPEIPGAEETITAMAMDHARETYGDPLPEVVRLRLEKELHAITSNGFAVLYLIAHNLVKKSNEDGYLVGSRGSVGSSLAATMTGITEVNPLPPHYRCPGCLYSEFIMDGSVGCGNDMPERSCPRCGQTCQKDGHDIPFETFLGFNGDKVPDIDLNFSGEYQPRAHKYVEEFFGRDHVFRAGTIATIAERTAYGFVKKYLDGQGRTVRRAEIDRLVAGFTGVKRTTGQHPGGLMVLPKDLDIHLFTPVQHPADDTQSGVITTHFDYHSISSRLVKLDILGHDDPTVIRMLQDLTGINPLEIPLDEPQTMSLFAGTGALGVDQAELGTTVGTIGIPEFGTRFVRQMLEETRPQNFSDLVRISGFSHGTDVWVNNAQDLIKNGVARLAEAISTRDDIMTYLIYRGMPPNLAFKIMEDVRKGKGVRPELETAMLEHDIPGWYIESCKKIKYMFPKAHAVAYVTMAFRIAYCKVYHPAAFYASFLTVRADEFEADTILGGPEVIKRRLREIEALGNEAQVKDKNLTPILEVTLEMLLRGIKLLPVSLTKSHANRFMIEAEGLRLPFAALAGVGKIAAQNIFQCRQERLFSSVEDLRSRAKVSKAVLEVMERHGCLRGMPASDQLVLFG